MFFGQKSMWPPRDLYMGCRFFTQEEFHQKPSDQETRGWNLFCVQEPEIPPRVFPMNLLFSFLAITYRSRNTCVDLYTGAPQELHRMLFRLFCVFFRFLVYRCLCPAYFFVSRISFSYHASRRSFLASRCSCLAYHFLHCTFRSPLRKGGLRASRESESAIVVGSSFGGKLLLFFCGPIYGTTFGPRNCFNPPLRHCL